MGRTMTAVQTGGSPLGSALLERMVSGVGGESCHPGTMQSVLLRVSRGFSVGASALCCLVWAPPEITAVTQVV